MKAPEILKQAAEHMEDRAATYDAPEGERSMSKTIIAFNTLYGTSLTEEQGWAFMVLLKLVRSSQGGYRADNYEDLTAYSALMGESAAPLSVTPDSNVVGCCRNCGKDILRYTLCTTSGDGHMYHGECLDRLLKLSVV